MMKPSEKPSGISREQVQSTLERYKKNRTLVPKQDLQGKYKPAYDKLRQQLKAEAEAYLHPILVKDLRILDDEEGRDLIGAINRTVQASRYSRKVGEAIFREYDLGKAEWTTMVQNLEIRKGVYEDYLRRHDCLLITEECCRLDDPQVPRIYNSVLDEFYDEATGRWGKKGGNAPHEQK